MAISLKKRWELLLGSTLETWAHHLLYVRHVYPRETFCLSTFLGVRCRANRHPDVVAYIKDSIKTAVPALVGGVADEVALTITANADDETIGASVEMETYRLRIRGMAQEWGIENDVSQLMSVLERNMRDLVLCVHGLESGRASSSDALSFKITLHIPEEDKSCSELNQGFSDGTWVSSGQAARQAAVIRPLHQASTPLCDIDFACKRIIPRKDNDQAIDR